MFDKSYIFAFVYNDHIISYSVKSVRRIDGHAFQQNVFTFLSFFVSIAASSKHC